MSDLELPLLDKWLTPLSDDSPCGEDLEYDPDFMALERDAQGTPERVIGDEVTEAEEPNWREVLDAAEALMERHRDLRTAFHYSRALCRREGLSAGLQGFILAEKMLEQFWESLHPQLDPDDDNDPVVRLNIMAGWADPEQFLSILRTTPFIEAPMAGKFSLRDLQIAQGDVTPRDDEAQHSMGLLEGAAGDMDPELLESNRQILNESLAAIQRVEQIFREKAGEQGPNLKPLEDDLNAMLGFLHGAAPAAGADAAAGEAAPGEVAGGAVQAVGGVAASGGVISSRDDVKRRLNEIIEWLERYEPSSPVALMLKRAHSLVGLNFLELVDDVAYDGYKEFERLVKIRDPSSNDDDD